MRVCLICPKAMWPVLLLAVAASAARQYPLFMQCDPAWGNNQMGVPGSGEGGS